MILYFHTFTILSFLLASPSQHSFQFVNCPFVLGHTFRPFLGRLLGVTLDHVVQQYSFAHEPQFTDFTVMWPRLVVLDVRSKVSFPGKLLSTLRTGVLDEFGRMFAPFMLEKRQPVRKSHVTLGTLMSLLARVFASVVLHKSLIVGQLGVAMLAVQYVFVARCLVNVSRFRTRKCLFATVTFVWSFAFMDVQMNLKLLLVSERS